MTCLVGLVGRPNVGKSTLFNRLSMGKKSIVHDAPGITRDRQYTPATLAGADFELVDTAGIFSSKSQEALQNSAQVQTEKAIQEVDVLWFMVDALEGITPEDQSLCRLLRKSGKPVILVANKCESKRGQELLSTFYALGFGEPLCISAEHKEGFSDLFSEGLAPFLEEEGSEEEGLSSIKMAIVGRPNVGKSTFINQVIREERLVTSDVAGTTRDSISVDFDFDGEAFQLIDTAGLRKRSRVDTVLEKQIVEQTRHEIQYAEVVVLMMDATCPMEKQDLTIARQVVEEGRAMVIVLNKIDQIKDVPALLKEVQLDLDRLLAQVKNIPLVAVSSLHRQNLRHVFRAVLDLYGIWQRRISTGQLNRWLEDALSRNPPPLVKGRSLKVRYVTQIKTRPPTFSLFVTRAQSFPESYIRYLRNGLRETFELQGVPLRLNLREPKNPYAKS